MHPIERSKIFCADYGLTVPVVMAPMAGACPAKLAASVSNAGGMGSCGALLLNPEQISSWTEQFRAESNGAFMLNNWIPDPEPERDKQQEESIRQFLGQFGPEIAGDVVDAAPLSFDDQCQAMLEARPHVISSIMGLYSPEFVSQMKALDIKWFATVTSLTEAILAEEAGADALVVQGSESGGHRGNFVSSYDQSAGLMSLIPVIADAVNIPLIATGGISDSRTISAALILGASAVQMGTGLLRTPEAAIAPAWADAIGKTRPEDTIITTSFSGKPGRAVRNAYTNASHDANTPDPAPYPIQRALTQAMRTQATKENNIEAMQAWAGQSALLSKDKDAQDLIIQIWDEVTSLMK